MTKTRRLTTAQATVEFLKAQYSSDQGHEQRAIGGVCGIFGHGNVAGFGQAMDELGEGLPFFQPKNEQSMVHMAMGYAKAHNRLATMACSASIGPGSTNMLTGAATATTNRIPVLLFPSDIFANRFPGNVLQQLEHPVEADTSVNDAFRPLSRFYDRVSRPEQLLTALPEAMRVLFDAAETGAVTVSLPQDVQGEAFDFPLKFFERRVWNIRRTAPNEDELRQATDLIATAKRPIIIAGGGVRYSSAQAALVELSEKLNAPIMETFSGKGVGALAKLYLSGCGTTGTAAAAEMAAKSDLVIAVGTRLSDFTTASRSAFAEGTPLIGINVNAADAHKMASVAIVADARETMTELNLRVANTEFGGGEDYAAEVQTTMDNWLERYTASIQSADDAPLTQGEIIRAVNDATESGDVVVAAAGTPPGEIMKAWDNGNGSECFLEFAFSCMGHEIPAGLGVAIAKSRSNHVFVVIGDGTYLMCPTDIVTAVQENAKFTTVVIENGGYQCIRALQEATTGADNFGNEFRAKPDNARDPSGSYLEVDYAANARSMGATVFEAKSREELSEALVAAKKVDCPSVVVVAAEARGGSAGSGLWWDLGVAEVSGLDRVQDAYRDHSEGRKKQIVG